MSFHAIKGRGLAARDGLGRTYGTLRGLVAERVSEVDTMQIRKQGDALRGQGGQLAASMRDSIARQIDRLPVTVPGRKPRRRFPVVPVAAAGAALGMAAAAAYLLYDRKRREAVRGRLNQVGGAARERYVQLGGVGGAMQTVRARVQRGTGSDGTELRSRVVTAISGGGELPSGLDIDVEGRTVYLKGKVTDAAAADSAAERAHSVDGVVAVVNRTTTPSASG